MQWVEQVYTLWVIIYLLSKIRIIKAAQFAPRLPFYDVSLEDALLTFLPSQLKDYSESDIGIDDELSSAVIFASTKKAVVYLEGGQPRWRKVLRAGVLRRS